MQRHRLVAAWVLGAAGYAAGLLLSTAADLPSGPVIVWVLVALAVLLEPATRRR
jgi:zinc/manganese transport system permease protein